MLGVGCPTPPSHREFRSMISEADLRTKKNEVISEEVCLEGRPCKSSGDVLDGG